MEITLITEESYPHHLDGLAVWCDQLVRELSEHRFNVLAITDSGAKKKVFTPPGNVAHVETVPLWALAPGRKAGPVLSKRFRPYQENFFRSLVVEDNGGTFVESLQMLSRYALAGQLSSAMYTEEAVEMLMGFTPVGSQGRPAVQGRLSVADAVDVLVLLEHFLRPLSVPPPRTDLCHATANGLGTLPALVAKWTWGTPFLLTEHGVYLRERYLSYKPGSLSQPARAIVLRFFKLLTQVAYENADVVAPVSRYNRLWEEANGTLPARIRPVPIGVDPASFPVAPTEPPLPTLVWAGSVDPRRDVETLLRALAHIRTREPDCRLRMFGPLPDGSDDYYRQCARLARWLGLNKGAATFEGPTTPRAKAYQAGHIFVLTSISEQFPAVVIEAMASGLPVVATDVGGVAEAVGEAGVLVPPRDSAAVAVACLRLFTQNDVRRALGVAARERVLRHFTTDHSFGAYRALYEELGDSPSWIFQLTEPAGVSRWPAFAADKPPVARLYEHEVLA